MIADRDALAKGMWDVSPNQGEWEELPPELHAEFRRRADEMIELGAVIDVSTLDDALCDALVAARQGEYDGLTVEAHLEHLIARVRVLAERKNDA